MHAGLQAGNRAAHGTREPIAEPFDVTAEVLLPRHDNLGGSGWCRGAHVCREVGYRDIDLVADGGDDRNRRCDDGSRHDFFIERPQVLDGPAAAPNDDHVDAGHFDDVLEGPGDVSRGSFALHARGANDQMRVWIASAEHLYDVANRRTVE